LAIGKGGHNIKLAGRLTGYEIDVYRDSDEVTRRRGRWKSSTTRSTVDHRGVEEHRLRYRP
jgi:transcription antitermination factor NusA-like protein